MPTWPKETQACTALWTGSNGLLCDALHMVCAKRSHSRNQTLSTHWVDTNNHLGHWVSLIFALLRLVLIFWDMVSLGSPGWPPTWDFLVCLPGLGSPESTPDSLGFLGRSTALSQPLAEKINSVRFLWRITHGPLQTISCALSLP